MLFAEAGYCSLSKCTNLDPDEDLPELSNHAKSSPGYTACAPGCGCINCGCFYCDPACLFYRYYAKPSSENIYEISRCATWSPKLRVKMIINENDPTHQELLPGIKYQLPGTNISITAINFDHPPLPAHQATFIEAYEEDKLKWTSFTYTQPSAPGVPTKGLVGEIQCASKQDAEVFRCLFDANLCSSGFSTKVSCICQTTTMSDFEYENSLPFYGQHHSILYDEEKEKIITESVQDSLVTLQLEAENATIVRDTTITKCDANQKELLKGCHSCQVGATTTIECVSRVEMKAFINCSQWQGSIDCGPGKVLTDIRISVTSSTVNMNCTVNCGITSTLVIEGTLEFQSKFKTVRSIVSGIYEKIAEASSILSTVFNWIWTKIFDNLIYPTILLFVLLCFAIIGFKAIRRNNSRRRRQRKIIRGLRPKLL